MQEVHSVLPRWCSSCDQTGTAGGAYSSTAGLTIDAATGAITPRQVLPELIRLLIQWLLRADVLLKQQRLRLP